MRKKTEVIDTGIGNRIKEHRMKLGMSQRDLAKCLEVSDTAISAIERGSNYPSIETLKKISDMFNISIDYLLKGEDK